MASLKVKAAGRPLEHLQAWSYREYFQSTKGWIIEKKDGVKNWFLVQGHNLVFDQMPSLEALKELYRVCPQLVKL